MRVATGAILVWACTALAQDAELTFLDPVPGREWSVALGVSADSCAIVGSSRNPTASSVPVRWTISGVEELPGAPPGFTSGTARAISADGRVIVGDLFNGESLLAFAWSETLGYRLLRGPDPGSITMGWAVSADGRYVAGRTFAPSTPLLWDAASGEVVAAPGSLVGPTGYSNFQAVSATGDIAVGGSASPRAGVEAMRWGRAVGLEALGDLPGGAFESSSAGVSGDGRVIVGNGNGVHGIEPFRWSAATGMVGIGQMRSGGFVSGGARAVSDDGWRVVGGGNAFIWDPIRGAQFLATLLEDQYGVDPQGWRLANVNDITADGTMMVGLAIDDATEVRRGYFVRLPPFCYADCDDSTGRGVLDIHDFLEFQRRFALQDLYSDCDQNGVHDFFDFLCFQNHFVAGCG